MSIFSRQISTHQARRPTIRSRVLSPCPAAALIALLGLVWAPHRVRAQTVLHDSRQAGLDHVSFVTRTSSAFYWTAFGYKAIHGKSTTVSRLYRCGPDRKPEIVYELADQSRFRESLGPVVGMEGKALVSTLDHRLFGFDEASGQYGQILDPYEGRYPERGESRVLASNGATAYYALHSREVAEDTGVPRGSVIYKVAPDGIPRKWSTYPREIVTMAPDEQDGVFAVVEGPRPPARSLVRLTSEGGVEMVAGDGVYALGEDGLNRRTLGDSFSRIKLDSTGSPLVLTERGSLKRFVRHPDGRWNPEEYSSGIVHRSHDHLQAFMPHASGVVLGMIRGGGGAYRLTRYPAPGIMAETGLSFPGVDPELFAVPGGVLLLIGHSPRRVIHIEDSALGL